MCGIFGMIGNIPAEHQREAHMVLTNLFRVSMTRGKDASGFAAIHNEPRASLVTDKRPISSPKFVKRCMKYKALKKAMPAIFIGHTRLSTAGNPSRGRNNHPFSNTEYSMVHNGVIRDWKDAVKNNGIKMRSETDSELILRIIERYSDPLEGVQTALDTLHKDSAMAVGLLRHSGDDIKLSLFRNDGRPLYIMAAPFFKTIFFASTKEIFEMALKCTYKNSAAEKLKQYGLSISEVPSFRYMEWGLNSHGNPYTVRKEELKKPVAGFLPDKSSNSSSVSPVRNTVSSSTSDSTRRIPIAKDPSTQEEVDAVTKAANEASEILGLISSRPYITKKEIEHWKKWRLQV